MPSYAGEMRLDGKEVHFRSARDALDAGIGMVHQELSIVPDLSVAENVFLGTQPDQRAASSTGSAWCARRASTSPASASTSIRASAIGSLCHRHAAADRDRPRAVLRRAHHHPGRADLGAFAARGGAAVCGAAAAEAATAAASSSSRISSTTFCGSPTRSRSSATAARSSPARPPGSTSCGSSSG